MYIISERIFYKSREIGGILKTESPSDKQSKNILLYPSVNVLDILGAPPDEPITYRNQSGEREGKIGEIHSRIAIAYGRLPESGCETSQSADPSPEVKEIRAKRNKAKEIAGLLESRFYCLQEGGSVDLKPGCALALKNVHKGLLKDEKLTWKDWLPEWKEAFPATGTGWKQYTI